MSEQPRINNVPTGAIGLVLVLIALAGRLILPMLPPDPRTIGATLVLVLWLAGPIVSIIAIFQNSGRTLGIVGVILPIGFWVIMATLWGR